MLAPRLHRAHAFPWDAPHGGDAGVFAPVWSLEDLQVLWAHACTQILPGPCGWGLGAAASSRS